MADEIVEEVPTEGTTSNGYLTKPYLVRNLQTFWGKIKQYITTQLSVFADKGYVNGVVDNAVSTKIDQTTLDSALAGKVDKVEGKGLSTNDFTNVLKDKLSDLPASAATYADMGFMTGTDKQNLDRLADTAITEVDNELKDDSENPVQNKVITEALSGKADAGTLDPLNFNQDFSIIESSDGEIIFRPRENFKHFKLHTEKGEIIEKFYISGTEGSDETEIFNTFNTNRDIRIPNPDGTNKPVNAIYKFYVECLEFSDSGKYKPFILKVKRGSRNPVELTLGIFKNQ